jgi:hypothetical protein
MEQTAYMLIVIVLAPIAGMMLLWVAIALVRSGFLSALFWCGVLGAAWLALHGLY